MQDKPKLIIFVHKFTLKGYCH